MDLTARFLQEAQAAGMTTFHLPLWEVRETLERHGLLSGRGVRGKTPLLDRLLPHIPPNLPPEEADFGVVEALWGVAETGTIILGPPRRLSLVPDRLIILLPESRLLCELPEALIRLDPRHTSAYVLLRGPSVTADIEKKIVHGVHGPREVILVLIRLDFERPTDQ